MTDSPDADSTSSSRLLVVFVKEPQPGFVKTRLAESLAIEEATRIYRVLCESVIEGVRDASFRTVVYYDPPESERRIRRWLGEEGLEFLAQSDGDLGQRLSQAFHWGFDEAELVCVVGTDIPELDKHVVDRAFDAIEGGADAVFGPAMDGGYYLLALRAAAPSLFDGIAWSGPDVLTDSLARAEAIGLGVRLLEPRRDVDRLEDVPADLLE